MSTKEDGGPAFPQHESRYGNPMHAEHTEAGGASLRDYFAAHALQGLVNLRGANVKHETELAYLYADEMLKARSV